MSKPTLDEIIDKYRLNIDDIPPDVIERAKKEYEKSQQIKDERQEEIELPKSKVPSYGFASDLNDAIIQDAIDDELTKTFANVFNEVYSEEEEEDYE